MFARGLPISDCKLFAGLDYPLEFLETEVILDVDEGWRVSEQTGSNLMIKELVF